MWPDQNTHKNFMMKILSRLTSNHKVAFIFRTEEFYSIFWEIYLLVAKVKSNYIHLTPALQRPKKHHILYNMCGVFRISSVFASNSIQFLALRSAGRPWNRPNFSTCFGRLLWGNVSRESSSGPKTLMSLPSWRQRLVFYCLILTILCTEFFIMADVVQKIFFGNSLFVEKIGTFSNRWEFSQYFL